MGSVAFGWYRRTQLISLVLFWIVLVKLLHQGLGVLDPVFQRDDDGGAAVPL